MKFGPTATVVIGVDEIMPGAEEHKAMGNMTATNIDWLIINKTTFLFS